MPKQDTRSFTRPLAEALALTMGYEVVDVEFVKEGPGRYLRVYLDKEGGIMLSDCECFHRALQPQLEAVDYDFLEVSSPGVDRPFKTERDWQKALGEEIELRFFSPQNGRKSTVGFLGSHAADAVVMETSEGTLTYRTKDIALAHRVLHFEEGDE